MSVKKATFIKSAPDISFCPDENLPEICFSGRSNVGKSSLINALANKKNLAKTSNVPGKTRSMNYFLIDDTWHLVDLPGYGYAKISKKEQQRWGKALEQYLLQRKQLALVILLVDIRHKPQQNDLDFMYWLGSHQVPFSLVLSKADKVSKTRQNKALMALRKEIIDMNIEVPIHIISAEERTGLEEFHRFLLSFIT
jgi:GTP-binding protein